MGCFVAYPQFLLVIAGSFGKLIPSLPQQQNSMRLMCLAHQIDMNFDQMEEDIHHQKIPSDPSPPRVTLAMTKTTVRQCSFV